MTIEQSIIDTLLKILTSSTSTFIAIFIPFCGAYWIYKKSCLEKSESTIYRIGKDIADELKENDLHLYSPLHGDYSYIDKQVEINHNSNKDEEIRKLLRDSLKANVGVSSEKNLTSEEASCVTIAIIEHRFNSLIPSGVRWSGRGAMHSGYGETISAEDKPFPFGTKLYRDWVDRFDIVYNDIFSTNNPGYRKRYVAEFSKHTDTHSEDDINKWLDYVDEKIKKIAKLHSDVVTQVQIIDNDINEKYFIYSLIACSVYILLLSTTGYIVPSILSKTGQLSIEHLAGLATSSILLAVATIYRLTRTSSRKNDLQYRRICQINQFINNGKWMQNDTMIYNSVHIDDLLSKSTDLNIPKRIVKKIKKCIIDIRAFNEVAGPIQNTIKSKIDKVVVDCNIPLEIEIGGFPLSLHDLADKEYNFQELEFRVLNLEENSNLAITSRYYTTTRMLYSVQLKEMNFTQRNTFIKLIRSFRDEIIKTSHFDNYTISKQKLTKDLRSIEKDLSTLLNRKSFDIIKLLASNK